MKKYIPLLFFTLTTVCASAQSWTTISNYQKPAGVWVTNIFRLPTDTIANKTGLVSLSGVIYSGNGTYWEQVGKSYFGGSGIITTGTTFSVDTALMSTRAWRDKLGDSLRALIGSGTGVANILDYGATPNDGTNDRTAILAAIATGKTVMVPPVGSFNVDGTDSILLKLKPGQRLFGLGRGSKLITNSNVYMIGLEDSTDVSGLYLEGSGKTSGKYKQSGIFSDSSSKVSLHDLVLRNFGGGGDDEIVGGAAINLYQKNFDSSFTYTGTLANIVVENSNTGIAFRNRSEYYICTNVSVNTSNVGMYSSSGNIMCSAGSISECKMGFRLANGTNNAHGSFSAYEFNHCDTVMNIDRTGSGFNFSACNFYFGKIIITNSDHIKFGICNFSSNTWTLTNNIRLVMIACQGATARTVVSGNDFSYLNYTNTPSLSMSIQPLVSASNWRFSVQDTVGGGLRTLPANAIVASSRALIGGTGINTIGDLYADRTVSVDTFTISTRAWRQKGIDSVAALIGTGGGGSVDTFSVSTRAWRQKGIDSVAALFSGYVPTTRTLNGLALSSNQTFTTGTSGSDFNISSSGTVHTFNIPDASSSARGLITTGTQTFSGTKTFTSTSNYALKAIGNAGGGLQFGSYDATAGGIWAASVTPSTSNYALVSVGSTTNLNATTQVQITISDNTIGRWNATGLSINGTGGAFNATAKLHLGAGTATANTAPLKFTSGTNLTTAEAGAMEYNGTNLFFTPGSLARNNILMTASVNSVSPTSPNRTITVVIDGTTYYIAAKTTND